MLHKATEEHWRSPLNLLLELLLVGGVYFLHCSRTIGTRRANIMISRAQYGKVLSNIERAIWR